MKMLAGCLGVIIFYLLFVLRAALADGVAEKVWSGAANGNWDLVTLNWLLDGETSLFASGDDVRFTSSAAVKNVVVVDSQSAGTAAKDLSSRDLDTFSALAIWAAPNG